MGFNELMRLDIQKFAASGSVSCTILSQSTANNTSTIRITFTVTRVSGTTWWSDNKTATINCDGQSATAQIKLPQSSTSSSCYADFTVSHANDGTKTVSYSASVYPGPSIGTISASGSKALTTIPRYAYFTTQPQYSARTETTLNVYYKPDRTITAAQYRIKQSGGSYGSWTDLSVVSGTWNTTAGCTFKISGLTANKNYVVQMRIQNVNVNWTSSNEVSTNMYTYDYPKFTAAPPNFTIGNDLVVSFYNPLSRTCTISVITDDGVEHSAGSRTGTSISPFSNAGWKDLWYNSIPDKSSGKYKVRLVCSTGNVNTVSSAATYSAKESDCTPTFSNFTWADVNPTTVHLTEGPNASTSSKVVMNYSTIRATISTSNKATAQNHAEINWYEFSTMAIGPAQIITINENPSASVYGDISQVSINEYKVRAIDSRGFPSATVTKTASNFIQYSPLGKTSASVSRTGNVSSQTTLRFSGTIWNNSFGAVTNSIKTATYKYKTGTGNWSSATSILSSVTVSGNTFSFNSQIAGDEGNNGFDVTNVYTIRVTVTDELSTATWDLTLNSGTPHVAYYKKGISIMGQYDEGRSDALQVNGAELVTGQIVSQSNIGAEGYIRTNEGVGIWGSAPYINFHYNNSSSNTSRIYESSSGELTYNARLKMPSNQYWTNSSSKCMDLQNTDIGMLNAIYFADECTGNEGINFLKQDKTSGSTTGSDYETLRGYRGSLYYNGAAMAPLSRTASSGSGYVRIPTSASGGIQICWGSKTVTTAVTGAWGSIYGSSGFNPSISFAKAFSSTPNVTISKSSQSNAPSAFIGDVKWNTSGITQIQLWRGTSATSQSYDLTYIAIGPYTA